MAGSEITISSDGTGTEQDADNLLNEIRQGIRTKGSSWDLEFSKNADGSRSLRVDVTPPTETAPVADNDEE